MLFFGSDNRAKSALISLLLEGSNSKDKTLSGFILLDGGVEEDDMKRGEFLMLTEQNIQFIEEYLKNKCKNATKAAIAAGYSEKTASSQASMLLKHPDVSEYLKKRKNEMAQALRDEFIFDALEAKKEMYKIMIDPNADNRDKITIARDFLDRAGFKPGEEVKLSGSINNPFADLSVEELKKLVHNG